MTSSTAPRYRTEGGKTCIDIRLKTAHQLFDGRDPAPFRERDLDENAVDYIVGAFEELPAKAEVKEPVKAPAKAAPAPDRCRNRGSLASANNTRRQKCRSSSSNGAA